MVTDVRLRLNIETFAAIIILIIREYIFEDNYRRLYVHVFITKLIIIHIMDYLSHEYYGLPVLALG